MTDDRSSKGGKARALVLSPERRSQIARQGAFARQANWRMAATLAESRGEQRAGFLEVFTGPVCAAKTARLIEALRRHALADRKVLVVRPASDTRTDDGQIASRVGLALKAQPAEDWRGVERLADAPTAEVVGIDEAQFFGPALVAVVRKLVESGRAVLVAGLDMDWQGRPFRGMADLMALADGVEKLTAVCSRCGGDAALSQKMAGDARATIEVGGLELYEPRCRKCWKGRIA